MKNLDILQKFGNVKIIPGRRGGKAPFCNSVFIDDELKAVIDPHSNREFCESVADEIDIIINSHFHIDHSGYNSLFVKSKLFVPEREREIYSSFEALTEEYGIRNASFVESWREFYLKKKRFFDCQPSGYFGDGEIFDLGKTKVHVISAPGHTAGHSVFIFEKEGLLFSVDVDLTEFGPWYGGKSSDICEFIKTIRKLKEMRIPFVLTGHQTGLVRDPQTLFEKFEEKIYEREKIILQLLEKPSPIKSLIGKKIIYPADNNEWWRIAEENMIRAHLRKLVMEGRVEEIDRDIFVRKEVC